MSINPSLIQPIPLLKPPTGWKELAIKETGEPLISLSHYKHARILCQPMYFQQKLPGAVETLYIRESVARKLVAAASDLPTGYVLLVWDAWRPLSVQQALFDAQYNVFRGQSPALSDEEIQRQTEVFVSYPTDNPLHPSPHYTGGSVDLSIADAQGHDISMGTGFDEFCTHTRTRFLEDLQESSAELNKLEAAALLNRRLLYQIMKAQGFANYAEEWWHFDYGNQLWATVSGEIPMYGPVAV